MGLKREIKIKKLDRGYYVESDGESFAYGEASHIAEQICKIFDVSNLDEALVTIEITQKTEKRG